MSNEVAGKNAGNEKKKSTAKIPFIKSMKFRILLCVFISALIVGGVMMAVILPGISSELKSVNKNYVYDLAESVGEELDLLVESSGVDTTKNELAKVAEGVSIKGVESSYCYIVGKDGTMLYHPTADKIGQSVENAVVKGVVEQLKSGQKVEPAVVTYNFDGVIKYAAYYVTEKSDFIAVVSADESDILVPVTHMTSRTVGGAVAALIICLIVVAVYINIMLRALGSITDEVGKLAYMDFSANPKNSFLLKRNDEIGAMGKALENLRHELVGVVEGLKKQSEHLYDVSEDLHQKSMETSGVIDQVDSAVHDIADGATSQANETQSATENVLLIGRMIEESNDSIQEIRGNSQEIHQSALVADETLQQLVKINAQVKDAIDQIYQQTHTTNESAGKIKEAAALITSIAEETNLLSLNASIEAARAGEHGRGFAVVANQIQKLAEQSNESANQIEGIISELIEDSERSVTTMEEVRGIVNEQDASVKKTGEIFKTVQNGINLSIEGISKISDDTAKIDEARVGVTDTVQNLTAIAEENAASTEETSASVTQVRTSAEVISQSAQSLNDIAMGIEDTMKKFKVD